MRIIGGIHRNRKLSTPKGQKTRPTSERLRESVFNICQGWIEGAHVLDLFAGSGAIGLEALSRGAVEATFVDKDRNALRCLQQNAADLQLEEQTHVIGGDVFRTLERLYEDGQHFDLIYVDPPYNKGFGKQALAFLEMHNLLTEDGTLFIEEAEKLPDPKTLKLIKIRNVGSSFLYEYGA